MVTQKVRPIAPEQIALSVPQVAAMLGFSQGYTWRLVGDGTIPSFKIGDRRLILRSAVDRLVAEAAASPEVPDEATS